ncbi:MAG: haloalkane dehalogenase, partial [Acidimicrobiales bacterium]|nr:haloalkane dehalogenase [Acidimicrobiales bacterium]
YMETVRTPEDRFIDLPDYPFEPHYAKIPDCEGDTLRVHYLDEGRSDGSTVLLIHGEPTWSYLYRDMIPPLVSAGHRVIAPDLVGFGRSDKPTETTDYSYARHVVWASSLIFDHLDLQDITFFGQDWGGLIGLRLVADQPDRYERVAIANTALPTGEGWTEAFVAWQKFSQDSPTFPIGKIVNGGCATDLPVEVIAAYDAPFPDDSYKAGARIFPSLVPIAADDPEVSANKAAWKVLEQFEKPFLVAFSDLDPVTNGSDAPFLARVPGTQGQPHTTIEGAHHFLQEDQGPVLAALLADFMAT